MPKTVRSRSKPIVLAQDPRLNIFIPVSKRSPGGSLNSNNAKYQQWQVYESDPISAHMRLDAASGFHCRQIIGRAGVDKFPPVVADDAMLRARPVEFPSLRFAMSGGHHDAKRHPPIAARRRPVQCEDKQAIFIAGSTDNAETRALGRFRVGSTMIEDCGKGQEIGEYRRMSMT